jgi:hypothetical protein
MAAVPLCRPILLLLQTCLMCSEGKRNNFGESALRATESAAGLQQQQHHQESSTTTRILRQQHIFLIYF